MKSNLRFIAIFVITLIAGPPNGQARASEYRLGVLAGTHGGPGVSAQITAHEMVPGAHWKARLGLTYATRNPGHAGDAREIFINDAENGTPEKSGRLWTWALDLLVPLRRGRDGAIDLYAGPRYASFTGNFRYIGGNEDFEIRQRTWAFGGGLEHRLPLSDRVSLGLQAGADAYLQSSLSGHDTTYSPDGDDVNPRKDFVYDDADEAVRQPKLEIRAMIGLSIRLGS